MESVTRYIKVINHELVEFDEDNNRITSQQIPKVHIMEAEPKLPQLTMYDIKKLNELRLDIFTNSKKAIEEMEKIKIKMEIYLKDREGSTSMKVMLRQDIVKMEFMKEDLRGLESMLGFYTKNAPTIPFDKQDE